ncbi:MAG: FeoA family protein [Pyrinomonadaceae bacterium]
MIQKNVSTLGQLAIGTTAKIISVGESGAVSRRLLEMGVVPGATVRVVKAALFGCPLEIRVRNSHLALRRVEANSIVVE